MKSILRIFSFSFVIIGAIIGAGFASGREIVSFFGFSGPLAVCCLGILFLIFWGIFRLFLCLGNKVASPDISSLNQFVFGKFAWIADTLILTSHAIVLSAMLASSYTIAKTLMPNFFILVFIAILMLAFFALKFGFSGVKRASNFVVPILIIFILIVALFSVSLNFNQPNEFMPEFNSKNFLMLQLQFILYAGMNALLSLPVIFPLGITTTKKEAFWTSFLSSFLVIFLLLVCMMGIFLSNFQNSPMPMIAISESISNSLLIICSILILLASFGSLLCSGFVLSEFATTFVKNKSVAVVLVLAVCTGISFVGFAGIVKYFYPIMGVFGVIFIISALIRLRKSR